MDYISIIICTCNRASDLGKTLNSLSQVYVPITMCVELLVVDNGSMDYTRQVIESLVLPDITIRYLHEEQQGKGYAYNKGIAASRGDILLFTDDDVRLPSNWIKGMCSPILSGNADAVAGAVRIAAHLERPWMSSKHRAALASTEYIDREAPQEMVAANMAFSKSVLEKVPYFDDELGPGALGFSEDTLFSKQLIKAGYKLVSAFDVVVIHYPDASRLLRSSYLDRARKQGRSSAYIYYHWRHLRINHPRLVLIRHQINLFYQRIKRRKEIFYEGCPEWEMSLLEAIHFCKHYSIEQKRNRRYQKYGLVKFKDDVR